MKDCGDLCKKISGKRGATMLIALLVFLIATLSGTIALTMAASNAGRYTHEKEDQQAYLSVVSAAELILDRLTGLEIRYEALDGKPDPKDVTVKYTEGKYNDLFLSDPAFQSLLQTYSVNTGDADPVEFTLTAEGAPAMGQVAVSVHLLNGIFSFMLYSMDGEIRDYQMTMQVSAKYSTGSNNFVESGETTQSGKKIFVRAMKFDMDSVKYTVEEGYQGKTV